MCGSWRGETRDVPIRPVLRQGTIAAGSGGFVSSLCMAVMSRWDDDILQEMLAALLVGMLVSAIILLLAVPAHRRLARFGRSSLFPTVALAFLLGAAPAAILHVRIGLSYHHLDHPGVTVGWPEIWMWTRNGLTGTIGIMLGLGAAAAVTVYCIRVRQTDQNPARRSLDIDS